MSILLLFLNFCKFGLLCFGGGYMLIPLLTAEFVGEGKLLTPERFGNLVSVSQLTPGPVGINTATFTGFLECGFFGALAATLGLVFPTLLLAGLAVSFIRKHREDRWMKSILYGARLGAVSLVFYAVLIFAQMSVLKRTFSLKEMPLFSPGGIIIALTAFILIARFKMQTTWVILISGALGALLIPFIG
ncbi:MAG: chromate transporter [Lentisphaeria bacterium]|nr:chromate transporter [Lentisphaeria bacterium]